MRSDIVPGAEFPDYALPDHRGERRTLSALQGGDPLVLVLSRGGYCPRDRRQHEGLVQLHHEMQVGYCRLVTLSTDNLIRDERIPRGRWRALDVPRGSRAQGAEGSRDRRIYRPGAQPDDPAHGGPRAGPSGLQGLQRLLVLRPPHRRGVARRFARRAAALPPGLGHRQRGAARSLGERRVGRIPSVRQVAGTGAGRPGLTTAGDAGQRSTDLVASLWCRGYPNRALGVRPRRHSRADPRSALTRALHRRRSRSARDACGARRPRRARVSPKARGPTRSRRGCAPALRRARVPRSGPSRRRRSSPR